MATSALHLLGRLIVACEIVAVLAEAPLETDGPRFVAEPPAWLEFTNETGASAWCSAVGRPAPVVTWLAVASDQSAAQLADVGGLRITAAASGPNATLTFPPFAATAYRPDVHAAAYRCRASSSAGTVLSREMRLRAALAQSYETQAVPGAAVRGGVAVLRCAVPPAVKSNIRVAAWVQEFTGLTILPSLFGDGKHHMMASSGDLYVYGVDKADARTSYRCRTQHRFDSGAQRHQLSANAASVTVAEPLNSVAPSVASKASAVQVEIDRSVALPCLAQGYPVPEIRWYRLEPDGAPVPMDESTASFGVLVIESAQPEDAAVYRCTASNSVGHSQPYDVRLDVVEPLRVELSPGRPLLRVDHGQSASIHCSFNSNYQSALRTSVASASAGPVVRWIKDGLPIGGSSSPAGGAKYQQSAALGASNQQPVWTLNISHMQRADQGVYQCFVFNDRESAQASVRIVLGDAAPQLVHTFNEQTVVPGPYVVLRCSAVGNPPPDITWLIDRQPLGASAANQRVTQNQVTSAGGETTGFLNVTSAQVEDGGEYTCLARNQAGEASHSARLNVYGLPHVRAMPKVTAVADADVAIKCPVAGYPIMEIVWMKGDTVLRNDGKYVLDHQSGSLGIKSVNQAADRGSYSCVARDRQGHTARRDFALDVVVAPKMTPFQPSDPNGLRLGERLTLTCSVTKGDLPLHMSWTVDGRPVPAPGHANSVKTVQIDAYTSLLVVDSLQRRHSGNYSCLVRNPATAVQQQQSQLVLIQVPPRINMVAQPEDAMLKQGIRKRLYCDTQGDKPIEFSWTKDGRPLLSVLGAASQSGRRQAGSLLPAVSVVELDADSSVLTIANLSAVHSGRYECAARNAAGVARQSVQLFVQVPPFWVAEPQDANVLAGQHLAVHCQADGYPKPNVTWTRSLTGALASEPVTNRTAPGVVRVMDNGTLAIRAARKSLQGRYTCRALNRLGQELTATISIAVHAAPRFRDSLTRVSVKRDSTASLHCRVEGDGPLQLAWRRSSTSTIVSNYRVQIAEKEVPGGLVSSITIPNAQVEDTGTYKCSAANSYGQAERDFQLTVLEPPDQPRNLHVQETTSRRATLSWLPPAASNSYNPLVAYVVQFKESEYGTWQEIDGLNVFSTTYAIEGLQPSTAYQTRVLAETNAGRGPPSDTAVFVTYGEPPGSSPQDLRAVALSSSSLKLSWSAIKRNVWHSGLIGYHLGFRHDNAISYNFTTVPLTDQQLANSQLELTLSQLHKATKYLIVIRAFNRYGEGPLSSPISVTTLEDVPSASPQSVRCASSSSSSGSVDVSWQPPPANEQNGAIQHYRVHYETMAPLSTDASFAHAQLKIADGLHATLANLAPHSAYRVRVQAATRSGSGPLSAPLTCLTDEAAPGAPLELRAFSTGPNSFALCWSPPAQSNGEILHYTVSIKPGGHGPPGSAGSNGSQRHTVPAAQTHYDVDGLAVPVPAFHEIWVTAANRAGIGEKSKILRFSHGVKPNLPAMCSFGRRLVMPWRTSVELPCRVIGTTSPISWTFNGKPYAPKQLDNQLPNKEVPNARPTANGKTGAKSDNLLVNDLQVKDSGNYTCSTKNGESATYQLVVLAPPGSPTIHVIQTAVDQIHVQWKQIDNGGSPLRGYLLHWRQADGGDWEEYELDRSAITAQLDNLKCGTRYQIYVTAYNAVGASRASNTITARTKGDVPIVPSAFTTALSANSSQIVVYLNGWQERGCPIRSFGIDYKVDGDSYWITVSEDIQSIQTVYVEDVQPSTAYRVRVRARSTAGTVAAEYDLVTLDHAGQTPHPDRINRAGRQLQTNASADSGHVVLPWWLIGAVSAVGTASLLGLVVACFCLYKTRNESRRLVASALPSESTLADCTMANSTWSKTQKSSSTMADRVSSKRSSTYELHSMGDKMPSYNDHHDDIYPYATFELHRDHLRSPVKARKNPTEFTRLKFSSEHTLDGDLKIPLRPPPTWSELSTIEVERHFQSSPTVSDSDLESLPVREEYHGSVRSHRNRSSSSGVINGFIHQPKDYASKSSLKRSSGSKGNHLPAESPTHDASPRSTLKQSRRRPSNPVPKKMPLIRLVDQSNLWSGQQGSLPGGSEPAAGITGAWTRPFLENGGGGGGGGTGAVIHRPKATRTGTNAKHVESPNDHSIAV